MKDKKVSGNNKRVSGKHGNANRPHRLRKMYKTPDSAVLGFLSALGGMDTQTRIKFYITKSDLDMIKLLMSKLGVSRQFGAQSAVLRIALRTLFMSEFPDHRFTQELQAQITETIAPNTPAA